MKQKLKDASPALIAILIFAIVEIINISNIVPPGQQNNFETMSNIAMLATALAGFFFLGIPSLTNAKPNLSVILSNISISAIAFPMNINVFGHTLYLEQLPKSLRGWHVGWTICIIMQILVLSGLGNKLLQQIQILFMWINHVCKTLVSFFSDLLKVIRDSNKRTLLILFLGFFTWGMYGGTLSYIKGITTVFSDIGFWGNSVLLWMYYFIVILLIHHFTTL